MGMKFKLLITTVCMVLPSQLTTCGSSIPSSVQQSSPSKEQERRADTEGPGRSKLRDEQVIALVQTEYGDLFHAEEQSISPRYLVGDFNGDGIDDIAIPVRLSRDVNETDKSSPPFWFGKPLGPRMQVDNEKYKFKMGDLARYLNEPILVVLHGTRQHGWDKSQPGERFVIVDGWDFGKNVMRLYRGSLEPMAAGDGEIEPPPHLIGDAILMIGQDNKGTALYWDGFKYRWYPFENAP